MATVYITTTALNISLLLFMWGDVVCHPSINGRQRHRVSLCFSLISAPRSWFWHFFEVLSSRLFLNLLWFKKKKELCLVLCPNGQCTCFVFIRLPLFNP